MAQRKGLGVKGKGLNALIDTGLNEIEGKSAGAVIDLDMNKIEPNKGQPRKYFQEQALEELAASIREIGVIQPILVKKVADYYEIVAGERRWRAAKIAGLKEIPAIIKDYDEAKTFEIALIENLQRENLNPIEEAEGYKRLSEELGLNQEEIAEKVGKSRSVVTNALRLLNLDERVKNFIAENKISNGHGRALLGLEEKDAQFALAERIIEEGLSVRIVEALVKRTSVPDSKEKKKEQNGSKFSLLEEDLKGILGTKVRITQARKKGKIEIEFYSDEDLDRLCTQIKGVQ